MIEHLAISFHTVCEYFIFSQSKKLDIKLIDILVSFTSQRTKFHMRIFMFFFSLDRDRGRIITQPVVSAQPHTNSSSNRCGVITLLVLLITFGLLSLIIGIVLIRIGAGDWDDDKAERSVPSGYGKKTGQFHLDTGKRQVSLIWIRESDRSVSSGYGKVPGQSHLDTGK